MWKRFSAASVFPKEIACQCRQPAASLRGAFFALSANRFANRFATRLATCLEERFANRLANRFATRLEDRFANCLLWRQFRFCFAGLSESSGAFSGSFALFLSAF